MALKDMFERMAGGFTFQGKELTYTALNEFKTVKVYEDRDKFERKIKQAEDGTLFLYEYREEMGFPDDRIDEFYVLVNDEADADKLNENGLIQFGRPHIYVGPMFNIKVKE